MIYVDETGRTYVSSLRILRRTKILTKVWARVSTRPFDHKAKKRSFTARGWEILMTKPGVMHRNTSRVTYSRGERFL
jgi:hypothetical protein